MQSAGEKEFLIHCWAYGLEPLTEYRFAPPRRFRFDFCWPVAGLAVEIEGGVWLGKNGGHTSGKGMIANMEKYNLAVLMGFKVLRFTPEMVKSGQAIDTVIEVLNDK